MTAPYCTIADVEAHTGLGYDAESQPSRTEVQRIITMTAREIDGALEAAGYTLPVGASFTDAIEMLKGYNALGASYRAWYAAQRGTAVFPAAVSWRDDYRDFLKAIKKNEIALPGIGPDDGGTEDHIAIIRTVDLTT